MSNTPTNQDSSESWAQRTLKIAGVSYILGDVAMLVAGLARTNSASVLGASSWLAGGVGAAYYGNPDVERQLRIQSEKLERYLNSKGITIPNDVREQSALLKQNGFWNTIQNYLYEHPSEILNGMYLVGAGVLLRGALRKDFTAEAGKRLLPTGLALKEFEKVSSNFWIGAIVATGALVGLLTHEDPEARKKAEGKGWFANLLAFVSEKPLRTSAALYTLNDVPLALQAWQDHQGASTTFQHKTFKPHYFSTLQLASYLFGNLMLLMSDRNQISKKGFDVNHLAQLEDAAARIVAAQPEPLQKALLADVSAHMASMKGVGVDAATLHQQMAERIGQLTAEKLAAPKSWAARTTAPDAGATPTSSR